MKWYKEEGRIVVKSDKVDGLKYVINFDEKLLFVFYNDEVIYFTDDNDEISRFVSEFVKGIKEG